MRVFDAAALWTIAVALVASASLSAYDTFIAEPDLPAAVETTGDTGLSDVGFDITFRGIAGSLRDIDDSLGDLARALGGVQTSLERICEELTGSTSLFC